MRPGSARQMASSTKSVNYVSQMAITSTIAKFIAPSRQREIRCSIATIASSRNWSLHRSIKKSSLYRDIAKLVALPRHSHSDRKNETAQMARSLAYRDGSMAHLFAYRRRLKWLARSHIATAQWLTCSHIGNGSNGSLARISQRLLFAYRRRIKWLARSCIATAQWFTC